MFLENIQVTLVETSHPGNIGAAARAMKTMGLSRLALVLPKVFPHAEATAMACGAADVLHQAQVYTHINDALSHCHWVFGASARSRHIAWPTLDARAAAEAIKQRILQGAKVALLFGSERVGLSNAQMDLCHFLVHIPCHESYQSLNVAQAVQIMAYELFQIYREGGQVATAEVFPPLKVFATHQQLELFYIQLLEALKAIDFIKNNHHDVLMRKLRRLFHRASMTEEEVHILRGILTEILNLKKSL